MCVLVCARVQAPPAQASASDQLHTSTKQVQGKDCGSGDAESACV